MKKYMYLIIMIIVGLTVTNDVEALMDNSYSYSIWCQYRDGYHFTYFFNAETDYLDHNFIHGDGVPDLDGFKVVQNGNFLKDNGLLDESNNLVCPTNPFGTELGEPTLKECGDSGCHVTNIESTYESYTCEYKNSTGNKKLIITETYNAEGRKWDISYPDGTKTTFNTLPPTGNSFPNSDCADIYYIPSTKQIQTSIDSNEEVIKNVTLTGLCEKYSTPEIEHYCSGECNYSEMQCYAPCELFEDMPRALPQFIKNIINIIKIMVPIALVILGMLDFGKAMAAGDEKIIKDSQKKFVTRIIACIAIFLITTITQLIFSIIGNSDTNSMATCINCFVNGSCKYNAGPVSRPNGSTTGGGGTSGGSSTTGGDGTSGGIVTFDDISSMCKSLGVSHCSKENDLCSINSNGKACVQKYKDIDSMCKGLGASHCSESYDLCKLDPNRGLCIPNNNDDFASKPSGGTSGESITFDGIGSMCKNLGVSNCGTENHLCSIDSSGKVCEGKYDTITSMCNGLGASHCGDKSYGLCKLDPNRGLCIPNN